MVRVNTPTQAGDWANSRPDPSSLRFDILMFLKATYIGWKTYLKVKSKAMIVKEDRLIIRWAYNKFESKAGLGLVLTKRPTDRQFSKSVAQSVKIQRRSPLIYFKAWKICRSSYCVELRILPARCLSIYHRFCKADRDMASAESLV